VGVVPLAGARPTDRLNLVQRGGVASYCRVRQPGYLGQLSCRDGTGFLNRLEHTAAILVRLSVLRVASYLEAFLCQRDNRRQTRLDYSTFFQTSSSTSV